MRRVEFLFFFYLLTVLGARSSQAQTTGGLIKRTPESVVEAQRSERRLTLDVQVTDASGKPVTGLEPQDLTLFDNGRAQAITSFLEINGSNGPPPAEVILILDTMNASFEDVVIERQGIEKFLRQNDGHLALPVSIVFLADTGAKLGQPTQDGKSLAEDLKKLPTPIRVIGPEQGGPGAQDRSQRSIRALQLLSTYEATRPERKLLIWVGPGWPPLSHSVTGLSPQVQTRYFNSIVDVTTDLRRAHITLYSVAPLNLAEDIAQFPSLYETYSKGVGNPSQADSPNLALQVLAVHSGGLVSTKSGDLAGQIDLCMADAQDYYEITFDAPEDDAVIRYHALRIKVDRDGAATRTNSGYYAGVPQSTSPSMSQQPASTSTPSTAGATATPQTFQAQARLVVVDVTAIDKKGQIVKGLSSTDFMLKEDNTPQRIVSVEEHRAIAADAIAAAPAGNATAGILVASNKLSDGTAWNVVLIDLYNIAKEDRGRLQSQLEQFLKQLPEHAPVALVTMLSHISVKTSFQDGAGAAYRYLHKNGLGPVDSSTPANILEREEIKMPSADPDGSALVNQANVDIDRQARRAQTTLDGMSDLARWLAPYPGKKNVYWLSGGFPLQGQPFGRGSDTKGSHPLPVQQKTDKELEAARIAIYPVDARGVAAPDYAGISSPDTTYGGGGVVAKDDALSAARRSEMLEIAKATGGTAQFNNNISQALSDDFNQANTYYTVTYTPPDKAWKGAYHRIQLSVDRPETRLAYREGYYAQNVVTPSKLTPEQFKEGLRPGAPSELAVQFTSKIARSGNSATVEYTVEPATIALQQDASSQFLTDIDFAIVEYGAKGKLLDTSLIRLSGKMTPEQRAHLSSKTLSAKQTIPIKAGATVLVLGVRDRISGRFGRVEVPLGTP